MSFAAEKLAERLRANISRAVIGKDTLIDRVIVACLCGGHILLEDIPGTGKTTLVKALARSIGCGFRRIQFTPDLLPSDVTGINYYQQKEGAFLFKPGPVFTNILLADELNRATPRTQSSLLECMAEGQVTVDGVTRRLPPPFFVIATQNPVETLGTYPLPEAQLDRFLMRISMASPSPDQEVAILERFMDAEPLEELSPVCNKEEIIRLQKKSRQVFVHPALLGYITSIAQQSRGQSGIKLGLSPRGSLALLRASQAFALVQGRTFVTPEDIKTVAQPVVAHRLSVSGTGGSAPQKQAAENLLAAVTVPTEEWEK